MARKVTEVTSLLCCLWYVAFMEVACWTVDLDEVREFLDKQKEQEEYLHSHYHNYYDEAEEYDGFSEVTQTQARHGHNYAHQYGYEGYMEKKVQGYARKGAQYLDGLRLALENYKALMENCSVYNFTEFENLNASLLPDVRWNETAEVWNWGWAQGERKLQWPQLLNISNAKDVALASPSGAMLGAQPAATSGAPPNALLGTSMGAQPGAPLEAPSGSLPGALMAAPLDAPMEALMGAPPGTLLDAPPDAPMSALMGAPAGTPMGATPGALLGAPQGSTPGLPPGATPMSTQGRATQFNLSEAQDQRAKCENVTREREHVRRLADLALFTARQLQDWANHEKSHDKSSAHAKEERALITRLAYFLDKLAELTGYTPDIKQFSKQPDRTTTTTSNPLSVPMSEELRQMLLTCMNQQAAPSATERCRAPLLLPPLFMRMLNITQASTTARSPSLSSALTTTPPPVLLEPELRQARVLDNYFLSSAWAQQPARNKRKRSLDEPLMEIVKYYTKHKAWTGSNIDVDKHGGVNVENHLTKAKSLEDRSDFIKRKLVFSLLYSNKNHGLRRTNLHKHGDKLKDYFDKLRKSDVSSDFGRKLMLPRNLKTKQKRSILIEESEDPMKDISYYVKNKPGTNVRPSLADAVRVRAALDRIFATGNIEVVRRYGANYNPLIPSPFFFGIFKTISDI